MLPGFYSVRCLSGCKRQSTAAQTSQLEPLTNAYHAETYNAAPAAEAVTATLMSMHVAEVFTRACLLFFFFLEDYRSIAVWPLRPGMQARFVSHKPFINAVYTQVIYGATAIKSRRVIAWKAIMKVEAAGLREAGATLPCLMYRYRQSQFSLRHNVIAVYR